MFNSVDGFSFLHQLRGLRDVSTSIHDWTWLQVDETYSDLAPEKRVRQFILDGFGLEKTIPRAFRSNIVECMEKLVNIASLDASEDFFYSTIFGANPIQSDRFSWHMYRTNLAQFLNHAVTKKKDVETASSHFFIGNALQFPDFQWMGNVQVDAIQTLRSEGKIVDFRQQLSGELNQLSSAGMNSIDSIKANVKYNLDQMLLRHRSDIDGIHRRYSAKLRWDVGGMLMTGTLAIASAFVPPISFGAALVGGGTAFNIVRSTLDRREQIEALKRTPPGILFHARGVKNPHKTKEE